MKSKKSNQYLMNMNFLISQRKEKIDTILKVKIN